MGLGAKLPLAAVSAEHVAVFALAVAVVGGALMQDPRSALQRTGFVLTLWPSVSLLLMVWAATGERDPAVGLWTLGPAVLAYLVILTVSSFAIAASSLVVRTAEAPTSSAARVGSDRIGMHDIAGHAARAGTRLTSFWRRHLPRLHKPLLALCGVVLAVGVVRAIVGASSGREEALAPAHVEPVAGPTVAPWVTPEVEPSVGKQAPSEPAEREGKISERMLINAVAPVVADQEPRVRREPAPRPARRVRSVRARAVEAPAVKAPAIVSAVGAQSPRAAFALGDDEWNQPVSAAKQPLTPSRDEQPTPASAGTPTLPAPAAAPSGSEATVAATRAAAAPPPDPSPAPKPAADPSLDALMKDVLGLVK